MIPLRDLRPGAIFVTPHGDYAVKSEYHHSHGQPICILLSSGEYVSLPEGDDTLVREVSVQDVLLEARMDTDGETDDDE